jgi:lipoate-protein ligase A
MLPLCRLEVYDDGGIRSAAENMAVDETLLESASAPTLRFYRWRRPSLSFGYFGSFADVAAEEPRREIVRRWTGGGIVLHGSDLTYSIILPRAEAPGSLSVRAVYTQVHEAIRQVLSKQSHVVLATTNAAKISDACFANPVIADLLADGRKIAGAAQRRTRGGLLHQGSIQYEALPDGFQDAFAAMLCPHFSRRRLSPELIKRAEAISEQKYGTAAWLRRR